MNNEELNKIIMQAEDNYESLKDTAHEQQEEIERLNFDKEQLNSFVNSCQKEIRRLKEELKQAKEVALKEHKYASEMEDKYITANNIINELDKWLEVNLTNLEKEETSNIYNEGLKQGMLSNGRLIKDKLQELKGGGSNE